jgi:anti-sigma28 factor (negative regulator of flagellin synthesis)
MHSHSLELLPGFEVTLGFRKKNLKNFVRFALKVFQTGTDIPSRRKPLTEKWHDEGDLDHAKLKGLDPVRKNCIEESRVTCLESSKDKKMRISDAEVKKALSGFTAPEVDVQDENLKLVLGVETEEDASERDAQLVKDLTKQVLDMPDREDMIASLKSRIEKGEYNPSSEEIVDTMIRRAIADRMR